MTGLSLTWVIDPNLFQLMDLNPDHGNIECGVPQGSVLRSLLFLIFIKYLNFAIKNSSTFHFADGNCFLNIKSTIKEINKHVNKDLRSLSKWLWRGNKLFTSESVKYLGVILHQLTLLEAT